LIAPLNDPSREALTITQHVVLRGLSLARAAVAGPATPRHGGGVTDAQDLAMRNGLKPGDILLGINGQPVDQPQDALTLAQQGGSRWQIEVVRAGQALHLRLRV